MDRSYDPERELKLQSAVKQQILNSLGQSSLERVGKWSSLAIFKTILKHEWWNVS